MIWMCFKSGPKYLTYLWMIGKIVGNCSPVFTMSLHTEMKCFYSSQNQKTILWTRHGTATILNKSKLFFQGFIIHNQSSHHHIGMPADIFCNRMQNDCCTHIQWILKVGRSKSII